MEKIIIIEIENSYIEEQPEPTENVVTWVYEEGSFVPCAKVVNEETYSIITDYLGTPTHAFNCKGEKVWERELDIYGNIRTEKGIANFAVQRFQGQYFDEETGLCYSRFRYLDNSSGIFISKDPTGLLSGEPNLYAYVHDSNSWIDIFGLYSDLKHSGDGHHLFPRGMGDRLGIRDMIEGVKWYPDEWKGTASLHGDLHNKLKEAGIPMQPNRLKYSGTLDEALDAMEDAYKGFDTKGFLIIDGKKYPDVTPGKAMKKVRQHIEGKTKGKSHTH